MTDGRRVFLMGDRVVELTRGFEGSRVSVALVDGSRIDDCELVSAGRHGARLWLYTNGVDTFVPLVDVADLWEVPFPPTRPRQHT